MSKSPDKKSLGILDPFKVRDNRNYGIELLRILAMFMVVLLHVLGPGGITYYNVSSGFNYWLAWVFEVAAYAAVDVYALISGFVGYKAKHRYSSIAELWLRVFYYTVIFSLLDRFTLHPDIKTADLIKSFFPVLNGEIWYFTMYFCLFFFLPLLNSAIENLSRRALRNMVIALTLLFSVFPFVFNPNVFKSYNGYSVIWLIVLYFIGAYFGKYDALPKIKKYQAFIVYLLSVAFTWASKYYIQNTFTEFLEKKNKATWFVNYTSFPVLLSGICLLIIFRGINPPKLIKRVAAAVSPLTFGIYVIHCQPYVFDNLITKRFKDYINFPAPVMLLKVFAAAVVIFIICGVIDFERAVLFGIFNIPKGLNSLEQKLIEKSQKKKNRKEKTKIPCGE